MLFFHSCRPFVSFILALFLLFAASGCSTNIPDQSNRVTPTFPASDSNTPTPILIVSSTPTARFTPRPCDEARGMIENREVPTGLLSLPVKLKIYLPPCYNKSDPTRFPVLYMLHGQTYTNDQWVRLGLADAADALIMENKVQPFLIVMPYEISWSVGPDISKFGDALIQDVIPYVESNYQVCSTRTCHAIGGLSRGGNWAVNLGIANPQLFSAIGAHSTPLFYGEINRINIAANSMDTSEVFPAIYIDVGQKDENIKQVKLFVNTLKGLDIPYMFTEFLGYHQEEYWKSHVQDYLLWYSNQFVVSQ